MKIRSKFRVLREVLAFFESALMGCFFSCFRIKEDARRKSSSCDNSIVYEQEVSLVSKKDVAVDSLFQSKGKGADAVSFDEHIIQKDFKIENCKGLGEIQASSNDVFFRTFEEDGSPSNFPSQPPRLDDMHSNLDEQSGAVHLNLEKLDSNLRQPENNYQVFIFEEQRAMRNVLHPDGNSYISQVDCEQDSAKLEISPSTNYAKIHTLDNKSPCPTPLSLTDEMQTPATIYPGDLDNSRIGKSTSIRTEYVYPVLRPVENLPQCAFLGRDPFPRAESDDTFEQQPKTPRTNNTERRKNSLVGADNFNNSRLSSPSANRIRDANLISTNELVGKDSLRDLEPFSGCSDAVNTEPETPERIIPCSSKWLKPQILDNEKGEDIHITNLQYFPSGMDFHADRPIIGTVAAHWIDAEPFPNLPKRWDGNGIPNSTTKYKEDQKVSWHATPFEERLKKVLSDEEHLPKRKVLYR